MKSELTAVKTWRFRKNLSYTELSINGQYNLNFPASQPKSWNRYPPNTRIPIQKAGADICEIHEPPAKELAPVSARNKTRTSVNSQITPISNNQQN